VLPLLSGTGDERHVAGVIVLMEDEGADGAGFRVHTAEVDGGGAA